MEDDDKTPLIIAVIVTLVLTAILTAFTVVIAFVIHRACAAKKKEPSATNPIQPGSLSLYQLEKINL